MNDEPQDALLAKQTEKWLINWDDADYSWGGLASKPAPWNSNSSNLQDFWRRDNQAAQPREDGAMDQELINFEGRGVYHVAYVPDYWPDGTPARAMWGDVQRNLAEKILLDKISKAGVHISGSYFHDDDRVEYRGLNFFEDCQTRVFERRVGKLMQCSLPSKLSTLQIAKASFTQCLFKESVGEALGDSVQKIAKLHFRECTFLEGVILSRTTMDRELDFGQSIFCKELAFWNCIFSELANFEVLICEGGLAAYNCQFLGGVSFNSSHFKQGLLIKNSRIQKDADFERVRFDNGMALTASDVSSRCTFGQSTWTSANPGTASLEDSTFTDSVNLVCSLPPPIQLFANARFKEAVMLSNHDETAWDRQFQNELKQADIAYKNNNYIISPYDSIIGGCQVLQALARIEGNSNKEFLWHRFELIGRRNSIPRFNPEKLFSYIYSFTADYGLSIPRPFVVLVIGAIVMGLLFAFIANNGVVGPSADWDNIWQGISFSFSRTFPIGVFGPDQEWVERLLGNGSSFSSIVIRSVATLQTFGSVVLIYLGVMSVRRKFKIG